MFYPKDSEKLIIGGGGGGDLNARVGNISQKLPANCSYRKNIDNVINDHGKILRDICSSFNCYVLNNMNIGDLILDGHFTFQKGDRKSQNDLVLINKTGLSAVKNVQIHRIGWNPSDHTPVSVDVEFDVTNDKIAVDASFDILSDRCASDLTKAQKIQSDKVDWNKYSVLVENDYANYENNLRLLHRSNQLDNVVNLLSDSLYKSATILSSKTIRDEGEIFHNQDPLIHEADKLLTEWHQGRRSMDEWESVRQEAITHLKQNVSLKEREAWANVLRERDSKDLWQKINWKGTFDKSSTSKKPSLGELREQFMKKGQSVEDSTLLCEITDVNYIPELDSEFSMEEIVQATKRLKNNKSSGDGWVNKMITNLPMCILYAIQIIYNTILSSHIYPTKWRTTVVSEFFKNKGETDQATNYCGISLVPLLSKLFDFILCNRFTKWFTPNDSQTAYQQRKSSADHVFLLRCLIQQCIRESKKLFVIAADFDGAFDRISRSLLIRKLVRYGAGSIFIACIAAMYMSTDNVIFRNKDYVTYKLFSGIKQGLPLSPILFIFYINDIFDFFKRAHGHCTSNICKLIHLIIHADDVTLLADDRENAIDKLKTLDSYCKSNHIIPQISKCKFLTINGIPDDNEPLPAKCRSSGNPRKSHFVFRVVES